MKPVTLSEPELSGVIQRVTPRGKEYAAARICRLLADHPEALTYQVARECSVGNISDQVHKCINPRIADLGLFVACHKPPQPILNKFSQRTGQMLWSFYRAANDPDGASQ